MKASLRIAAVAGIALIAAGAAVAGDVRWSVTIGTPVYQQPVYQPAPRPVVVYPPQVVYPAPVVVYPTPQVVYQQPQVIYQQPPVVYQQPRVIYQPQPVYYEERGQWHGRGHGHGYGHRRHYDERGRVVFRVNG
jgi:hypothetical protein